MVFLYIPTVFARCDSSKVIVNESSIGNFLGKFTGVKVETAQKPTTNADIIPPSPPEELPSTSVLDKQSKVDESLTPVQFEQYAKEFQQMTNQDNFDGFRLEAGKPVTRHMQASHTLFLGTSMRDTGYIYQFGPTFALEDGSFFLMGRYGNDGCMTARGVKKFFKYYETRLSASSSLEMEQRNMFELALDRTGKETATGLKAAWQGTWILNSTFSQLIAPNLHMGCDLTWIASNGATTGSVGLRYALGSNILSGILTRQPNFKSLSGLTENIYSGKFQYFRKISERLSLGTELELSQTPKYPETYLRMGYEYLFRMARIQGLIDFSGKISMMAQTATGFGVSGMINFWRGEYKFGFMMQVIPPPEEVNSETRPISSDNFCDK